MASGFTDEQADAILIVRDKLQPKAATQTDVQLTTVEVERRFDRLEAKLIVWLAALLVAVLVLLASPDTPLYKLGAVLLPKLFP